MDWLYTGVGLVTEFIGHFDSQFVTTFYNQCYMHTNILSHGLLQSSCNGFQRQIFPFLWVPELSPCLSKSNSLLPAVSILNWTLDSYRLSTATTPIIAAAPHYIASALTAQKTQLLTIFYCCLLTFLSMVVASFLSRSRLSNGCIRRNTIGCWMK
jgi:hypothetical protein